MPRTAALTFAIVALIVAACSGAPPSASSAALETLAAGTNEIPTASPAAPRSSWTSTGAMLQARLGQSATLLADGRVLVAGGFDENPVPAPKGSGAGSDGPVLQDSAEIYDPRSGSWTATGRMTSPGAFTAATLLLNGRVLVAGGCYQPGGCGSLDQLASVSAELFDPRKGT